MKITRYTKFKAEVSNFDHISRLKKLIINGLTNVKLSVISEVSFFDFFYLIFRFLLLHLQPLKE
jgi:hypothetical protein